MKNIYTSPKGKFVGFLKVLMVVLLIVGSGVKGWGQVTMANFRFENNLTAEIGSIGSPTLTASVAPTYFGGVTGQAASHATSTGKYFELLISTTGYTNIDISFAGRSSQSGSTWVVTGDATGGTTFAAITSLACPNGSFSALSATTLGATYDNKASIRIRITAGGTSATLRIDDLIIRGLAPTCTAPGTQATALTFSSITANSQTLNFTRGDGDAGVLIIGKAGSAATDPASGTGYPGAGASLSFGSGTAVGTGTALYYGAAAGASLATVQTVTNLAAETRYYYNFYEYNASGICYNLAELAGNAWSLSTEPTGHSATFTNSVIAYNQINLAYSLPSTVAADGYVILRRADGTNPSTTGIVNGTAPASWTLPAGTTLVTANATGTGFNNTGLTASINYCYLLIPFNWNGTNSETYNYRVTATVPTTCGTTPAVPDPAIAINSTTVVAGNINIGSSNNIIYGFSTAVTLSDATFNGVSLPTTFTSGADFSALGYKLWYNTTNTFSGATQLGTGVNPTGSNIVFTGLSQIITTGSTGYFFITADVSPTAIATNTIIGNALPIANVNFSGTVTKSGSPVAAGLKTIILLAYTAFDDFTRSDNLTVGIPSSGGSTAWTEIENASGNNGPARIFNNQLMLVNTDNLGNAIGNGYASTSFDMSSKYATNYSTAASTLTWVFNFRSSRTAPSGFGTGNTYAMAFVVGSSQSDPTSATGNGYAVILGNSSTPDPVKLVKFAGGLNGTLTDLCVSTVTTETNYYSVKVEFDPCTNLWSLQVRDDGAAAFADPTTNIATAITATDVTYTNINLNYLACHFKYGASAGENCRFDNIYIPSNVASTNTYTWNGATTDYQVATNWTPTRNCPKINDVLVFDASSPAPSNVTNVPTQTIGKLLISGNRIVSFKDNVADAVTNTITIGGGTGDDFVVQAGSTFNFDVLSTTGTNALVVSLLTGAIGDVSGTINFNNTFSGTQRAHQLLSTDASSITVKNGGLIRADNLSGNPFGNTGTANTIIFQLGSIYESADGGNPFGLAQPSSKVVFQTGSLYRHLQTPVPSFFGRTYANFEFNVAGTCSITTGSLTGTMVADNLSVLNGVLNVSGTLSLAPVNMNIKGDLTVASGATFNYSPGAAAYASTIGFTSSSSIQKINSAGTITFGRFATLELNNTHTTPRLDIETNITIQGTLKVTAGNLNLTTGDITIQSDATSTANISAVNGTITYGTGRFSIERYLRAFKSWRFLATPIIGGAGTATINESWREGGTTSTANGYGTRVTGPGPIGNPGGVDEYTLRGSMKSYSMALNNYVEVTSADLAANKTIANDEGYYVFVRGDRGVDVNGAAGTTNLRMRGQIRTSNQTFSVNAFAFQSVGNPFASQINFTTVTKNNVAESFYIWNPSGGFYGVGQFENYSLDISNPPNYTRNGSLGGAVYNFIESGQAFFINSTVAGSIVIKESDKSTGSTLVSREGTQSRSGVDIPTLEVRLKTPDLAGIDFVADEVLLNFDNNYSSSIDNLDIRKILNSSDNLSIKYGSTNLVANRRPTLTINDTIFLHLTSTRTASYRFEIDPSVLGNLQLAAFLKDKFLQTETPVSLTAVTNYNFNITADVGSRVADRFMIVFRQPVAGPLPVRFIDIAATKNADKTNAVKWTVASEINMQQYEIERSDKGTNFVSIGSAMPLNNMGGNYTYNFVDAAPLAQDNFYRIKAISVNGQIQYSAIVKILADVKEPFIAVSPNPVENKTIQLQMGNQAKGLYSVQLINTAGQTVYRGSITVNNYMQTNTIELDRNTATGNYQLLIVSANGDKTVKKIMVQ